MFAMRVRFVGAFSTFAVALLAIGIASTVNAQAATAQTLPKPAVRKPAPAPEAPKANEGLTNADVLQMVAAELSEDIILNTIEDAPKKAFDLSAMRLVALKNGGVSDEIIRVMQGRPRTVVATPAPAPVPVAAAAPAVEAPSAPTAPATQPSNGSAVKSDDKKSGGVPRLLGGGLIGKLRGKRDGEPQAAGATASAQPKELKNGEPAVINTALTEKDAITKVKAFLNGRNLDFNVNPDTDGILTDWFDDRRCGPGIQHCANRASVRITLEDSKTVIRVQVMERKREGGLSEKPWHDNSESRGKETAKFSAELEAYLAHGQAISNRELTLRSDCYSRSLISPVGAL